MTEGKLHPDVVSFKEFVERNPKIIREARTGKHDLNYYFKHYQKYGESDSLWSQFGLKTSEDSGREEKEGNESKKKWTDHIKGFIDKIEFENLDQHVKQADSAIGEIKKLVTHFSELKGNQAQSTPQSQPTQPPVTGINRRFF